MTIQAILIITLIAWAILFFVLLGIGDKEPF